jgi:hypothetical protein
MQAIKRAAKLVFKALPALESPLILIWKIWRYRNYIKDVAVDFFCTHREAAFLRNASLVTNGKFLNIYVVDDESIYWVKLMAFISQAFRLDGWTVRVVFRNRAALLGQSYFRSFGVENFVYLDDFYLDSGEKAICARTARELLKGTLNMQVVKAWTFSGCWIGPQMIATLSRSMFEGYLDFSNSEVRQRLQDMLPSILEHVLKARKLIEHYPGNLALTIEANYAVFGPLVDVAIESGCEVVQMIQPWRDDALVLRRLTHATRRDHPSSVARETLDELVQRRWTAREEENLNQLFEDRYGGRWFLQGRNQRNTRPYSAEELRKRFALDPDKPTAVVFSQVLWDANLFYGSDIFEDAGEWLVETVRAACANNALNWLVKLHPANVWKRESERITKNYAETLLIQKLIGRLPPHVKIIDASDDISTLSLFQSIDYGVTLRGTAGMELVCFGKPCVTAGTGRYSNLGFTLDSEDRVQYLQRLAGLQMQPSLSAQEIQRAKWHAYAAFSLRAWCMRGARSIFCCSKGVGSPIDHNLKLEAASLENLISNGDLHLISEWVRSGSVDFINAKLLNEK